MKRPLPLSPQFRWGQRSAAKRIAILLLVIQLVLGGAAKNSAAAVSTPSNSNSNSNNIQSEIRKRSGIMIGNSNSNSNNNHKTHKPLLHKYNILIPRGGGPPEGSSSNGSYHHPYTLPQTITLKVSTLNIPVILTDFESFCRTRVFPAAKNATERVVGRITEYREQQREAEKEQLERNKQWRETAEHETKKKTKAKKNTNTNSPAKAASRIRQRKGADENENETRTNRDSKKQPKVKPQPSPIIVSYASSSLSESDRAFNSSSFRPTSLKTALLPTRVLKLSLIAFVLAEALDRVGILYEDTPAIFKAQAEALWFCNILPLLARLRLRVEMFYHRCWKPRLGKFYHRCIEPYWLPAQKQLIQLGIFQKEDRDFFVHKVASLLSTTKATFALGAAAGMIATPVVWTWTTRSWKLVGAVFVLAEANHYCKRRGRKLVQVLGDTPQTLGATLDGILDQFQRLVRKTVLGQRVVVDSGGRRRRQAQQQQQQCVEYNGSSSYNSTNYDNNDSDEDYHLGYNGIGNSNGGVADQYGDTHAMTLMDGMEAHRKKKTRTPFLRDNYLYSLGISSSFPSSARDDAYYRNQGRIALQFDQDGGVVQRHHNEKIASVDNDKRKDVIKHGFLLGCAIGLSVVGK
eukprot:CAMPEP_0168293290 /NCGR_PEP_ID=MMETSP0142_2-20121227/7799_1 /TAXON_ID=44445 /ORGANISM="Pseudo-nitzschia australis, Strain 10249 10 AB" /LENGTH=631 /DNA_ID=CAMNT_0008241341 /DNA_START=128 /DNA_END=2023 /DNA_ORIENTATION=-